MATVTLNKKYPFEVWLTSVGIAPVLFLLMSLVKGEMGFDIAFFLFYVYMVFYGALLSLPVLGLFYLIYNKVITLEWHESLLKLLLALVAIAGMCITFLVLSGKEAFTLRDSGIAIPVSYTISIILSSLFNKLK